MLKTDSNCGA